MASRGTIRWRKLRKHLDKILPSWTPDDRNHARFVWCPEIRPDPFHLPRGGRGERDPEIELGHVKRMFRFFGRLDEARTQIPQLR